MRNISRALLADLTKGAEENLKVALKWGTKQMNSNEITLAKNAMEILNKLNKTLKR